MRFILVVALLALAAPVDAHAAGLGVQISRSQESGDTGEDGGAYGVFLRLNLIGPLHIWVDGQKMSYDDVDDRQDRRLGTGLQLEVPGLGKWVPLALAGVGIQEAKNAEGEGNLYYTELGLGLAYRLTNNLRLELDIRRGTLARFEQDHIEDKVPRSLMAEDSRRYHAGRLSVALEF